MSALGRPPSERLILEAGRADRRYWRDLWRYRELLLILAWRDVSVRYKRTAVGIAWAVIRPFLTTVVFTVLFGHIAKIPTNGAVPYAIVVIGGLLPWTLFSSVLADASNSVVSNSNLISKVCFPRLIIPLATVLVVIVDDFAVSLLILAVLSALVRCGSRLADPAAAGFRSARPAGKPWPRDLGGGDGRQISRLPLHHSPLCCSSDSMSCPVGIPELRSCRSAVAPALPRQSHGWDHRWLPLVHPGRRESDLQARASSSAWP